MAFKINIVEVYAEESVMSIGHARDVTAAWKYYRFPYPVDISKRPCWSEASVNLAAMKQMLTDMELRNGIDYIFCSPGADTDPKDGLHIQFKDDGEGLMATMRWMASDWYRKQS
jgi:hypothetical protein